MGGKAFAIWYTEKEEYPLARMVRVSPIEMVRDWLVWVGGHSGVSPERTRWAEFVRSIDPPPAKAGAADDTSAR